MKFFQAEEKCNNSNQVLLFVHGYTGGPGAFSYFSSELSIDYVSLILPGHGRDYASFSSTKAEDWLSSVSSKIEELRKSYTRVYLAGYSLGGILSLLAGSKADGLFLFAPAVAKAQTAAIDTKARVELKDVNPALLALTDNEDKDILSVFLSIDTSCTDKELERARRMLFEKDLILPAYSYAYLGEKDPVVPLSAAVSILKNMDIEYRTFKQCTHAILYGDGYPDVRKAFLEDLDKVMRMTPEKK